MPSRMDKYYAGDVKKRTTRNQELYKTIYDETEYTNVEGISIIEKNEKIDIDKIRELLNGNKEEIKREAPPKKEVFEPIIEDYEEKNYDIRDVLDKAKTERDENTQYDILKNIDVNKNLKAPQSLSDEDLKQMIEKITSNSRGNQSGDLLDDLKTIHDSDLTNLVEEQIELEKTNALSELDKSFFTSSLGFKQDDFDDVKEMKQVIKKNNTLTKILLFVLLIVLIIGILYFL